MAAKLDFILINPGGRKENYQGLLPLTAIEPPIWCGLMAGYLRKKGYSVKIVDANALELTASEVAHVTLNADAHLAVIVVYGHNPSASTQVMPEAGRIARAIRKKYPEQRIAMAGGHVAALPEQTLSEETVDYVCGDEGLQSLITALDYAKAKSFRGTMISAPLITDLDNEVPDMAFDLLPMAKYRAHNWQVLGGEPRQPYASIYTTLGCPYNCHYCCIQAPFRKGEELGGMKKHSYRMWSPEVIGRWVRELHSNYGVRTFKFADELFLFDYDHVEGICAELEHISPELNIWAYARVDRLQESTLLKMRKAGIKWLCLGIESGSEAVRHDVNKNFLQGTIKEAVDLIHACDIHIIGNYLFGLPEDDIDTMNATLRLAQELNCEYANFYCAMAYPGSALYETAKAEGWSLPRSWSGYSQLSVDSVPLPTRYISGKEVQKFRDDAFHKYFKDPLYLEMIDSKFGQKAVDGILNMLAIEVKRA